MGYSNYEVLTLDRMLARVQKYAPGDGYQLVEKAYHFAEKAHAGQFRKSGEAYFIHPCFVASILTDLMIDPPTIAAGLLHDTVEDCEGITLEVITNEFSKEVAELVDGVTKLNKLDFANREEAQAESLRKMILAMGKDIRVVLIKLADRLHNMRTLEFQKPDRQAAIARETLDIYAPIAHRLGVYAIKQELEDLSLRYIDPDGYRNLVQKVGMKRAEREAQIRTVIEELSEKLDEARIHYDIDGRPKHFYSIYRKMVLQNKPFEQIYDLIAIRVIVDTIPDCYAVLGLVHTLWTQMPGRFKDYISVPKANMYQSLHTTVMGGRRMPFPFEVQIRTWDMHRLAEYGIAAHWRYKEGGGSASNLDNKLFWVRQVLDWQNDTHDSKEFIDTLKTDLFAEEVFVFTPKGDVISIPKGATPLDFAYRIHSGVGNSCTGAKINGKIVPLDTPLQTGDFVSIITSSSSKGPSMDWLKIVKTPQAKTKIRQYIKREFKDEHIATGKDMVERELRHRGFQPSDVMKAEYFEPTLQKYSFTEPEDLLAAVGYGSMAAGYIAGKLIEAYRAAEPAPAVKIEELLAPENHRALEAARSKHSDHGIVLVGSDVDMPVRLARCCSPVPGDDIVGYITRGRGVTIHKAECPNAIHGEAERRVDVDWAENENSSFFATIKVVAVDRVSLLGEIASFIGAMDVPIKAASATVDEKTHMSALKFTLEVHSKTQLEKVIKQLLKKSDVMEVFRVAG